MNYQVILHFESPAGEDWQTIKTLQRDFPLQAARAAVFNYNGRRLIKSVEAWLITNTGGKINRFDYSAEELKPQEISRRKTKS